MNKFSIPAFVENITPDTANAKYSKAKLKMYYIGETVDHRKFTKEFSDKLFSTIAYTPVVGFYSVADEDFVGHNNLQHIYGLVPADAALEYVEDAEQGVTFAVTDIILYTGRPDEIGVVASKIVGKQHSLELDPNTIKYKLNYDEAGKFQNLEFIEGELIGLSVLGDNETPAFTGSEFFSTEELPEFITDDNRGKYQALFNAMFSVEPTAEEVITEIYKALETQRIYGYVCEHIADKYVVINTEYGVYSRYLCGRAEDGSLMLSFDCNVRSRFLSDAELETLQKGSELNNVQTAQINTGIGTEGSAANNPSASTSSEDNQYATITPEELEALRSDCERLAGENEELTNQLTSTQEERNNIVSTCQNAILNSFALVLNEEVINDFTSRLGSLTVEELINGLNEAYANTQSNPATIVEMTAIDIPLDYKETDANAVIQKYLNI